MKTRLVSLTYRGTASVDPRYSAAMLPWTINDIRSMENYTKLSVGVENGVLETYNSDFELQFGHPLKHIVGMCRIVHKQHAKGIGNGFLQIKASLSGYAQQQQQQQQHQQHLSTQYGVGNRQTVGNLTTSTSYGSLSASAAAAYNHNAATLTSGTSSSSASNADGSGAGGDGGRSNFMEFTGPLTGLVYLMKDPRDPLLHIYLFECEAVEEMAELMHQMRDPAHTLGGSVGSIPQTLVANSSGSTATDFSMQRALAGGAAHSTPASNQKLMEGIRNAQHDPSPNIVSSKMKSSKSYTHGLSNSAGTVHIPTSTSAQGNLSLLADISPNHTHFFEVMYVGKIRVSHKRVPFTFIDDALPKFKAYDAQRSRLLQTSATRRMSLKGPGDAGEMFVFRNTTLKENDAEEEEEEGQEDPVPALPSPMSPVKTERPAELIITDQQQLVVTSQSADVSEKGSAIASGEQTAKTVDKENKENKDNNKSPKRLLRGISQMDIPIKKDSGNSSPLVDIEEPVGTGLVALVPPSVIINSHSSPERSTEGDVAKAMPPPSANQLHPTKYALENVPKQRDRSASYGCIPPYVEQNRTMVFLVGRSDLRLISPDRKQVLLYKDFKDVASCAQGQKCADHFGIICREAHNNDGFIGYVFKCQSEHVCDDIVAAIMQAFDNCAEQKKKEATQIFSCEHCPMLWYHKLCSDVEGLSEKKTQAMIFRRIESLGEDEQNTIWAKFYGSEKMSSPLSEQNQFLMMLLRAHCESRQQRHVHDTAENRSEFLNQYLGGSTIFMKAKRSLTNSFDHLLKRKASKDDIVVPHSLRDQQIRESSAEPPNSTTSGIAGGGSGGSSGAGGGTGGNKSGNESPPEGYRSRSNTLGTSPSKPNADQLKSPMMDIFMKVGNSSRGSDMHQGSWRQAILNSVVTPSKGLENDAQGEFLSPMRLTHHKHGKRTGDEWREMWRTAIRQTILLNRMEKENAMLLARQNENELKRIKLDYEEIVPCDRTLIDRWEMIIERDSNKIVNKKDPKVLAQAIKNGVPRSKRGDVWTFLADQHSMNTAPVDTKKFPNFNTPYHVLLKSLTEHQHAIFIDLGRTFPNHTFYKDPLGVGQLSLFNLLKAYSILDPELGYCQGLGFICGILLLHCDETDAFQLLKHLMFRRQLRTKYLPDMKKFQLQLYQLSRLVKDHLPDLYQWLDVNDVSPTLYAAPWILTVFSSQFPLGFVARVFDLLFLESSDIIFKFAIALLTFHKDELLKRDNFEEVMDYLKTVVPKIESDIMDKLMRIVFTMDISRQLTEYNVEYNVLQEEISTTNHHLEMLNREKAQNQHLEQQLQFAQSSIAQLEKTRSSQQTQISGLQSQVQSLEVTIQTLGRFVEQVAEQNTDLELPGDVRRILQQLVDLDRQRRRPLFTERKIGKSVSVNSHLGFPLKVLEELNERDEHGSPQKKKEKTPFFEHTYEQLRQQRTYGSFSTGISVPTSNVPTDAGSMQKSVTPQARPNRLLDVVTPSTIVEMQSKLDELKLPEHVDKYVCSIKTPTEVDSGVGTPLSPPSTCSNSSGHSSGVGGTNSATNAVGVSTGSLFSRMGYRSTPSALSPLAQQKTYTASSQHSTTIVEEHQKTEEMHPLSMVGGDVNVRFNGTSQLKSLRPVYHSRPTALIANSSSHNNTNIIASSSSSAEHDPAVVVAAPPVDAVGGRS